MSITPRMARVGKWCAARAVVAVGGLLLMAPASAQASPIDVTPPVINGALEVGATLTASTGTWRDPSAPIVRYEYAWLRCLQYVCTFIDGANSPKLTLTPSLSGLEVVVSVTAIDALGEVESAESEQTDLITYTGPRYSIAESVSGSGFVRGFAGGIAGSSLGCPGQCGDSPYLPGTDVELIAEPDRGATFLGWGGACSGTTPTCSLTASSDTSVSARFTSLPVPIPPEVSSGEGASGSDAGVGAPALVAAPALGGEEATGPPGVQAPARLVSLHARRGRVEAVAACERASSCRLSLAILSGRRTLARHAFTVPAWRSVGMTLALDSAGARLLARHHRLPVAARLALRAGGRWATVASRRLTVTS
jgi:hypothetical protein